MVVIRMQMMHYEEIKQFKMYAMYVSKHHFLPYPKTSTLYFLLYYFKFIPIYR